MIEIAQLGCGYWGPNLLRNFSAQSDCHVKWVAEEEPKQRQYVEANYPKTKTTSSWQAAVNDPAVEAVVIATPASTHYTLARAFLEAGKHVFVEKPLAMCLPNADDLVALAAAQKRTLMVGDTFLYNAAVRYLQEPLKVETSHFLECVRSGEPPITGPRHGHSAVSILEAGQKSLRDHGHAVTLHPETSSYA